MMLLSVFGLLAFLAVMAPTWAAPVVLPVLLTTLPAVIITTTTTTTQPAILANDIPGLFSNPPISIPGLSRSLAATSAGLLRAPLEPTVLPVVAPRNLEPLAAAATIPNCALPFVTIHPFDRDSATLVPNAPYRLETKDFNADVAATTTTSASRHRLITRDFDANTAATSTTKRRLITRAVETDSPATFTTSASRHRLITRAVSASTAAAEPTTVPAGFPYAPRNLQPGTAATPEPTGITDVFPVIVSDLPPVRVVVSSHSATPSP
ncbi:Nn.00g019660.m01.CDS01 [Neocucurbitaria sp. VM-36]